MLLERGLSSGYHAGNGRKSEVDSLLSLMTDSFVRETQEEYSNYSTALLYSLIQLLGAPKRQHFPFYRATAILEDLTKPLDVGELAHMYKMSEAHFIRSFKKARGTTPANYRIQCRITQAKNLLSNTELSVAAIAEQCGISDALYFSRLFKKYTGMNPTEFRRDE